MAIEPAPRSAVSASSSHRRLTLPGGPMSLSRVTMLDDEGQPVPEGTPGELCIRGPSVLHS